MTTGVIIQARMGSKRFPGKVLAKIDGCTVLEHVVNACTYIEGVDKIIVAHPGELHKECIRLRVAEYAGDEGDVLGRYFDAAEYFKLAYIVRVTADCPLLNPYICTSVLKRLTPEFDYASNVYPDRTCPKGLDCEAFTFDCLQSALVNATEPYDREHVTPWMQRNARCAPSLNLCVDYPEDIARLEAYRERFVDGSIW